MEPLTSLERVQSCLEAPHTQAVVEGDLAVLRDAAVVVGVEQLRTNVVLVERDLA